MRFGRRKPEDPLKRVFYIRTLPSIRLEEIRWAPNSSCAILFLHPPRITECRRLTVHFPLNADPISRSSAGLFPAKSWFGGKEEWLYVPTFFVVNPGWVEHKKRGNVWMGKKDGVERGKNDGREWQSWKRTMMTRTTWERYSRRCRAIIDLPLARRRWMTLLNVRGDAFIPLSLFCVFLPSYDLRLAFSSFRVNFFAVRFREQLSEDINKGFILEIGDLDLVIFESIILSWLIEFYNKFDYSKISILWGYFWRII